MEEELVKVVKFEEKVKEYEKKVSDFEEMILNVENREEVKS